MTVYLLALGAAPDRRNRGQVERDSNDLDGAVSWLESCWQPAGRRLRPARVQNRGRCLDTMLPRIEARLDELWAVQLADADVAVRSGDRADAPRVSEALGRYQQQHQDRGRRVRNRAAQLRERAQAQEQRAELHDHGAAR